MRSVMTAIAERDEVVRLVGTPVNMLFDVVQLKVTRIFLNPLLSSPTAAFGLTGEAVTLKNLTPHIIWNCAIVCVHLPVFLEQIQARPQLGPAIPIGADRPAFFRPQLTDTTSPFLLVACDVPELIAADGMTDILTEVGENVSFGAALAAPDIVGKFPSVSSFAVLFLR